MFSVVWVRRMSTILWFSSAGRVTSSSPSADWLMSFAPVTMIDPHGERDNRVEPFPPREPHEPHAHEHAHGRDDVGHEVPGVGGERE